MSPAPTPAFEFRAQTLAECIEEPARHLPDVVALSRAGGGGERFTFAELDADSRSLALALLERGLVRGERVGLISENRPRWAVAYLAIQRAGGIVVPMDALLRPREIAEIGQAAEFRTVFVSVRLLPVLREALPKVLTLSLDGPEAGEAYDALLALGHASLRHAQLAERRPMPSSLAALIFTSGTTGRPKAVALSHANIIANIRSIHQVLRLSPADHLLSVLPLHHTFECTVGLWMPLSCGAPVCYARSLKSRELAEDLRECQATVMLGVPLLYEKLLSGMERALESGGWLPRHVILPLFHRLRDAHAPRLTGRLLFGALRARAGLGRLRFFVSGAAALPLEVFHGFQALGVEIVEGYGLTESSPVLTVNPPGSPCPGSVGLPIPGVELRIAGAGADGVGEVLARGENIMVGYYADPRHTAEVVQGGWLHTGDLGRLDEAGRLHLGGRSKSMIATGAGKKIFPEEVEAVLGGSPYIAESMVYGRRDPRSRHEEVCALLVPNRETVETHLRAQGKAVDPGQVKALLQSEVRRLGNQLADYKRVRDFEVRELELPRTTTGKVKRFLFANGVERPEADPRSSPEFPPAR